MCFENRMRAVASLPTRSRDGPPTGSCREQRCEKAMLIAQTVAPVPSGESPDGTGESPVLSANRFFKHALSFLRPLDGVIAPSLFPRVALGAVGPLMPVRRDGHSVGFAARLDGQSDVVAGAFFFQ